MSSTGIYCSMQQEDNATLGVLLWGALAGLIDFSHIIIMRTASNFDRLYPGQTPIKSLLAESGGFAIGIANLYLAGVCVVQGITGDWDGQFRDGVKPTNYVGDIFGSLGGKPDFGIPTAWYTVDRYSIE
ncbi:purine nucleoside [Moniliophthora roreri MCA 2997]|uniref:Purine nucleoside n=2 Tax=Moniliophthora roreri TaxID=221103 RepID=V2X730_MONRO|nr:purine nucleoside [Moniliophthora roreri MCA 2997]KAI3615814.1 purine nucleoside [Moniliophthora roreri]